MSRSLELNPFKKVVQLLDRGAGGTDRSLEDPRLHRLHHRQHPPPEMLNGRQQNRQHIIFY